MSDLSERLQRIIDATFLFPHSNEHGDCPRCIIYTEARAALDELRTEASKAPPTPGTGVR